MEQTNFLPATSAPSGVLPEARRLALLPTFLATFGRLSEYRGFAAQDAVMLEQMLQWTLQSKEVGNRPAAVNRVATFNNLIRRFMRMGRWATPQHDSSDSAFEEPLCDKALAAALAASFHNWTQEYAVLARADEPPAATRAIPQNSVELLPLYRESLRASFIFLVRMAGQAQVERSRNRSASADVGSLAYRLPEVNRERLEFCIHAALREGSKVDGDTALQKATTDAFLQLTMSNVSPMLQFDLEYLAPTVSAVLQHTRRMLPADAHVDVDVDTYSAMLQTHLLACIYKACQNNTAGALLLTLTQNAYAMPAEELEAMIGFTVRAVQARYPNLSPQTVTPSAQAIKELVFDFIVKLNGRVRGTPVTLDDSSLQLMCGWFSVIAGRYLEAHKA